MIGKGAHEVRPATLAEVLKVLEKRQGTSGEFGFEQQTSLDYAKRFSHLKLSDAEEMFGELVELGMKPEAAAKAVDILPNKSQLMLILAKDKTELSEKKLEGVLEAVEKFRKKAKKFEPKVVAEALPAPPEEPKAEGKSERQEKEGKKE
jgi:DNA-directed RNA polymerase subunit F